MAKKVKEPQYIASRVNTPMLNYRVYYMTRQEKLLAFLVSFAVGGVVSMIFYGGQFLDSLGNPTRATTIFNVFFFVLGGVIGTKIYLPMRTAQLKEKRRRTLTTQFRSFLESLSVAMSSGMNMLDSMSSALGDLKTEYGEKSYIVHEISNMLECVNNNITMEDAMQEFGERSEIDDVINFSTVFSISYRAGGDTKNIVRRTNRIISDKLEINEHIETAVTSNKAQFNIMLVVPVVIVLMLRTMSSDFARSFSTLTGIAAITVAIGFFVAAYILAQKILDVKG